MPHSGRGASATHSRGGAAILFAAVVTILALASGAARGDGGDRQALFGDLHVHTRFSFDAYIFNIRATPEDAYRYARGAPLAHAYGYPIRQRGAPLDFMAVTDHATYLGVMHAFGDQDDPLSRTPMAARLISSDPAVFGPAFRRLAQTLVTGEPVDGAYHPEISKRTWARIVAAAEAHYEPGKFTTFPAYEYTSNKPYNLHRNVVFKSANVPEQPFAATDSVNPEDLWRWMDEQRATGIDSLAIPHNSNWSNGTMFQRTTFEGDPLNALYAATRMRNEPIVEMTQIKGTSDTHPLLSPNDEWADYEIFADNDDALVTGDVPDDFKVELPGSYVRDALLTGMGMEQAQGSNPYQFGFIGSSDTHNAGAPFEEEHFYSKTGLNDGTPQRRGSVPPDGMNWAQFEDLPADQQPAPFLIDWSASGLAGVWAESNTRDSIYAALERKETFATSGTRIRVRMFAGFNLARVDLDADDAVTALYTLGTPMGGAVPHDAGPMQIVAWATRDPASTWLQRLQVIKGWIDASGEAHERVFDVACSDGQAVDPDTHRCPHNGATVNLDTCEYSIDSGSTELKTLWNDPDFDPQARAFYYLRVLENPTCRWSTWDALRAGVPPRPGKEAIIQERAWSSPVWYTPR